MDECIVVKKNLGLSKCDDLPQMPRMMITTPSTFAIDAADLDDEDAIKEALQDALKDGLANRIYLWPKFVGSEDLSEEGVYEDTPLSYAPVRDGNYRFRFHIKKSMCLHKAMFTHRSVGDGRVFIIDNKNQLFGTELSNGDFAGFTLDVLNTEKLKLSDGSVATKSPILVALADSTEIDERGVLIDGSFINELIPLTDVELAVVVVDQDNLLVTVTRKCDGVPVSGLVFGDFNVTTTVGVAQQPTAAPETASGSGIYALTRAANFASGFVNLVAASSLTIDAYEAVEAKAFVGV